MAIEKYGLLIYNKSNWIYQIGVYNTRNGGIFMIELFDVSWGAAFGFGVLSFFSPCILPLIPVYIMYITGISVESELEEKRAFAFKRTLGFVLGFTIIFMIMGTSASFIGRVFARNKILFSRISGLIIILFGLNMTGILNFKFLNMEKRMKSPKNMTSWFSSILMGMAFAAGWTPCFGPVLAAILVLAGNSDTLFKGTLLLFIYSMGMAIPFLLTSLFVGRFSKFLERGEKWIKYIPVFGGVIMIIFGLLVFFNKMIYISNLLL